MKRIRYMKSPIKRKYKYFCEELETYSNDDLLECYEAAIKYLNHTDYLSENEKEFTKILDDYMELEE